MEDNPEKALGSRKGGRSVRKASLLRRAALSIVVCLSALAVLVAPAQAEDFTCNATIVGGNFDNVVVPEGGTCLMTGVTIKGNVKALKDSRLEIRASTIGGSIEGDKADIVQAESNRIGGGIQIKEGGPSPIFRAEVWVCGNSLFFGIPLGGSQVRENIQVEKMTATDGIFVGDPSSSCAGNTVERGNIKVEENLVPIGVGTFNAGLRVRANQIGTDGNSGNLQVFKNTGAATKFVETNNVSKGVIQCYENGPPFDGSPNMGKADPSPPNQCTGTP
jgi:hypothetical protein